MEPEDKKIIFITPCHNEEGRVGKVVASMRSSFPQADIVVIDDCSSDGSVDEARSSGATVLRLLSNLGYGVALQTGYMYALRRGYDILLQLDADGQHSTESIGSILSPVLTDEADISVGSRHLSGDSSATPTIRRMGQKFFSWAIWLFGGPRLTDPTSGFQAMNRKALALFANDVFPCDYPDSDVILMAHYAGLRIKEVPATMLARDGGTSIHAGLRPVYYGIKMLFSMIIVLLNRRQWKHIALSQPEVKNNAS